MDRWGSDLHERYSCRLGCKMVPGGLWHERPAWIYKGRLSECSCLVREPVKTPSGIKQILMQSFRIDRLPSKEAEKLSDEESVKGLTSAPYFLKESSSISSDPLGLSIGDSVSAETDE
jgi:hypothetical protein